MSQVDRVSLVVFVETEVVDHVADFWRHTEKHGGRHFDRSCDCDFIL